MRAGSSLGPYRVLAKLGEGGMGEVWRARDTRLDRDVALKILPESVAADSGRLARFEREARTLAAVNHPNIVTIFAVDRVDDVKLLAMELVEGQTLDQAIGASGMPLSRFLDVAVPMVDAVAAAHERGIVHRDLKPANVMITREGGVKVLDFGLAKAMPQSSDADQPTVSLPADPELTSAGSIVGTVAYMSPEQVRGEPIDPRSDVFSLGVVLYQMATGGRPFDGKSTADLLSSILRDQPLPVNEHRPDLPAALASILERCLAKAPRDRYQASLDLAHDLRRLPAGVPAPAPTARPGQASGTSSTPESPEGFWVAVVPFRARGAGPGLAGLVDDLTDEIVTGLSRFSYLRVIARSSTERYADAPADVRTVGRELGARYVMEGSVRQSGSSIRIASRLADTVGGANLWAGTYDRPFDPDRTLDLVDDVAPRIVSTSADMHGVLPHTMSEALRSRDLDDLTPYEAVLRSFGYVERLTADEHAQVRTCMERAVERAPGNADALAMLSFVYAEEFKHGFNMRPGSLDRALAAARSAVAAGPANNLAYHVLAQALFFRRELPAFRNAADRAIDLNPMDGGTIAFMGILLGYAGDWERGPALAARAMALNPNHPGWYHFSAFWDAYRQGDYQGAVDVALRINLPSYFHYHGALAMAYGQLGNGASGRRAIDELLEAKPDFADVARDEWRKWLGEGELLEHALDGLRKAGLAIPPKPPSA